MRQHVKNHLISGSVFVVILTLVGITVQLYSRKERSSVRHSISQELLSIADIKERHIAAWRRERLSDANFIYHNRVIAEDAATLSDNPADSAALDRMTEWIASMRSNQNFTNILCLSRSGIPIAQMPAEVSESIDPTGLMEAASQRKVVFSDIFLDAKATLRIDLIVPLFPKIGKPEVAGFVILTIDPRLSLFPAIEQWTRPSRSAEVILVTKQGNEIVFMNRLRHRNNAPTTFRVPYSGSALPAARALSGFHGFLEGVDYRGVPTFAAVGRIPNSPWALIVKIDREEVYESMNQELLLIGLMLVLVVLATGSTILWLQKGAQARRAEETAEHIRRNQSLLNGIIEGTSDVILAKDCEGRYLMINDAGSRVIGKPVERIIGTFPADHFPSSQAKCIRDKDKHVLDSGELMTYEESIASADGMVRQYLTTRAPIRSGSGEMIGVFGISRDVTLLKETEEQLRIYQTAVEQSPASIVITDVNGIIEYVNKRFSAISGYSALELIGKRPSVLKSGTVRPETYEQLWKTILSGGEWRGEICNKKKNGELYWEDAFISPLRDQMGNISHFMGIKQDITRTKEMEQHMLHSQRMESIGTLAGGIAHDLNNVLAPILITVELLKERSNDPLARELLKTAESAVHRGREIIRQVLSFARGIEGEKIVIQPKHILKEIDNILRETFPRSIHIENDVQPDLALVSADVTQIHQVLMNLCVNARDAMDGKGKLKLGARNVLKKDLPPGSVVSEDVQDYVCFYVQDNGVGIPPELQERIFDPFFTTKGVGKGTGLGLSTTYTIVRKHGGFIDVQSQPGFGALFSVYLPAVHSGMPQAEPLVRTIPHGAGEGILVVDDEAFVRNVTQQILENFGYKAYMAEGGHEAVKIYSHHHQEIAAVITDWMMPEMDGAATIRGLQQIDPAVRVIVSTGLIEESATNPAVAQNIRSILNKPYSALSLLETLREVLA